MTRHLKFLVFTIIFYLLAAAVTAQTGEKWSRQIEDTNAPDSFDWVPLAKAADGGGSSSKDRSGNGRVLTYSQTFPPNGPFRDVPKPPGSFDFPFQLQRFPNGPQAQPLRGLPPQQFKHGNPQPGEPTSQSFFKFEMPYHGEGARPAGSLPTVQTGYQIQHSFGGLPPHAQQFNPPLFNQQPLFPPEFHPQPQKPIHQQLQQKPIHQNFIEDTFPAKSQYKESKPQPSQHSLQQVAPQVFPSNPEPESVFQLNKPSAFDSQQQLQQGPPGPSGGAPNQQQEVQLLYVPYDTLYNQNPQAPPPPQNSPFGINKYNVNPGLPAVNPYQINQFYTPDPLVPQEPHFFSTSTTSRPLTTSAKPSNVFESFASPPQFTTAKPKPKAHQPPLAMFLLRNNPRPTQSDVVTALRDAGTVAVIDAPTKQTPDVFVGPAGMPIPSGYVKFDLPYLSQLTHSRDLREVPFFVAPLSYRTPNGFNKILLPEPHVGSIVVNRAKDIAQTQQTVAYNTLGPNEISQYQSTTPRPRTRVKQPSPPKDYYSEAQLEQVSKTRNPFEITTQRATLQPTRGNKFTYFYDPEAIQEVTSPKVTKHDRPKKKRPQSVQVEQPHYSQSLNNPYAQFNPVPNQIANNEYYKQTKPTTTSTSTTSTTTSTTSTTTVPPTYFTYSTSPQVDFQSTNGQLYPEYNSIQKVPVEEVVPPRFTTRAPTSTIAEEEYRMKQYFRQQDAFRNRQHPTNAPSDQVQYTPVSLDYEPEKIQTTTQRNTTPKQRVTFYTPSPRPDQSEHVNDLQSDKILPANHRPSYNQNEILEPTVEYDPNPYQLPSELPPLTPNLPGLVNNLQTEEKQQQQLLQQQQQQEQQNAAEQSFTTTAVYEPEQPTRPTRRPINRVRKPVVAKVTSSVSYSESESSSRRPGTQRVRRPFGSRDSVSTEPAVEGSTSTTRRPSGTRSSSVRNPNRVRYQPTPEERQTLRLKPRKQYNGSKKVSEAEDLDYQRDVLKQNYPVFKPASSSRRTTSPTAIPSSYAITTTEGTTSESQQVYTVTPSNSIDSNDQNFPAGLLEPMQIAQQYNEYYKDNYGPGYFPNQEDLNPTEPVQRNEINPIYTTLPTTTPTPTPIRTTTSTTEEPTTTSTTKRSPFIRRNFPRVRTTTTEIPTTTVQAQEEKTSARPRIPPRKVIKVRARTRRPTHPASSTANPEEEVEQKEKPKNNNYRKLSRFNQDLYENDSPRRRHKPQFQLEGQESQWSPSIKESSSSHFKPVNPKESHENQHKFENEPEIVTAGLSEAEAEGKNSDTYEINVSANFGSSGAEAEKKKSDRSFADMLEEVMGKAPEEQPTESDGSTRTTDTSIFESQRTTVNNKIIRRGKWKKLRAGTAVSAHNNDSFETAESQNLGSQLFNSLYNGEQEKINAEQMKTTTPMSPATEAVTSTTLTTTTPTPQTTLDTYEMTTPKQVDSSTVPTTPMDEMSFKTTTTVSPLQEATEESATRRFDSEDLENGDDQDTQPSLFSEVKRQLHELFAIEESDDQAVTAALAAGRRRQDYTSIKRVKPESTETTADIVSTTEPTTGDTKKSFHKNLMDHVVYATSTSTKVTSETEICYRGRCIRSEDLPPNHKLN